MRADDLADFEEYVRGRGPALYRLAYLLVGHSHDAQDLVQDVLGTVSLRWAKVRRSDNVDAYLRRAICNAAASRWRHRSRRPERLGEVPEAVAPAGIDLALRDEVLSVAASGCRMGQREVLVLRYYEQLTERETAAALGISVGTVKSQANKAAASLRGLIAAEPLLGKESE